MVYLGWMLPADQIYETKARELAKQEEISVKNMLERIIDTYEKNGG